MKAKQGPVFDTSLQMSVKVDLVLLLKFTAATFHLGGLIGIMKT